VVRSRLLVSSPQNKNKHKDPDSWVESWVIFSKFVMGEVSLSGFFQVSYSHLLLFHHALYLHIAITRLYKTTSSLFKLGAVSLTQHVGDF